MKRVQIYLSEEQLKLLKYISIEENTNVSEVIRRSIDKYINDRKEEMGKMALNCPNLTDDIALIVGMTPERVQQELIANGTMSKIADLFLIDSVFKIYELTKREVPFNFEDHKFVGTFEMIKKGSGYSLKMIELKVEG